MQAKYEQATAWSGVVVAAAALDRRRSTMPLPNPAHAQSRKKSGPGAGKMLGFVIRRATYRGTLQRCVQ
jgi:hypothetical protein